jgi:hypothetical protein
VKYHCYNKGALTNLFCTKFLTISQFLNTDYNLILLAKNLVTLLPVTIVSEWVKGHYKGDNREYKGKAERIAKRFSKTKRQTLPKKICPALCLVFKSGSFMMDQPSRQSLIKHGSHMCIRAQNDPVIRVHALTVGFLRGPYIFFTAAFHAQFNSIGWYHLLMGH